MTRGRGKIKAGSNTQKNWTSGQCKYLIFLYTKRRMEIQGGLLNISRKTILPQKSNKKKSETCKIKRKTLRRNPASTLV
jgi:hypothetical protein